MNSPAATIASWYETLAPENLEQLDALYHPDVYFKDPFHETTGRDALRTIFGRMFEFLDAPRFTITERFQQDAEAVLLWRFDFGYRGRRLCIEGCSHLRFGADGRVVYHRDHWDAAEQLYERLPLVGAVLRGIKRRISSPRRKR